MMKRMLIGLLVLSLLMSGVMFSAAAEEVGSNMLVVYFSLAGEQYGVGVIEEGNTSIIAHMIAEYTGADLFEIQPVQSYPTSHRELLDVSRQEMSENARPEIAETVQNWEQYDTVFIGYPNWWGDMPMIVYNFLESYDFSGKTIVPFCTHGGSGLSNTERTIASLTGTNLLPGFAIPGTTAQNEREEAKNRVNKWLVDNGFEEAAQIDDTDDAQAVLSAYQARLDAMVSMDITALDSMMDDALILRHITGDTQTKQEWLDCIANEEMRYYNIDLQNVQVEVNGDLAVVHHTAALDASIYGSRGTWTLTGDSYYAKVDGQWIWTNAPQD